YQHDVQEAHVQCAENIELQEGRRQAGWHRDNPLELIDAQQHAEQSDGQNAQQNGTTNFERIQYSDEEKAENGQQSFRLMQIAQGDQGGGVVNDDARADQRNDGQ